MEAGETKDQKKTWKRRPRRATAKASPRPTTPCARRVRTAELRGEPPRYGDDARATGTSDAAIRLVIEA